MNYFCTLFDSNYLSRGLALYDSLIENCPDFTLYVFAFDDKCQKVLETLMLKNLVLIPLSRLETPQLLEIKKTRSSTEYCWTCTPAIILYCLEKFKLPDCTYLDADLYFYNNPQPLLDEAKDKSVLITEHRYTPEYDQTSQSGIYCVQFMYFKNDHDGLIALKWWAAACLEWCFAVPDEGKFGDQKYLDDWTTRFKRVQVLQNLGGGVAPWNIQQYEISLDHKKPTLTEKKSKKSFQLIFYHFQSVKFMKNNRLNLSGYRLSEKVLETLYKPYILKLLRLGQKIQSIESDLNPHGIYSQKKNLENVYLDFRRRLRGAYKIISIKNFE